jgi:hypothetical protein
MIDTDIYNKIKLMIEKKLKSNEIFTYDEIYGFFLDEKDGEITKNITDKEKLVRRAKAVVSRWGTQDYTGFSGGKPIIENVWKPFADALHKAGFTNAEIYKISQFKAQDDIQYNTLRIITPYYENTKMLILPEREEMQDCS